VTTENKENDILEIEDLEVLVEKEKATLASKFDKAKVGDLVRISNINFFFNSEKVMEQSFPLLDELFDIMLNNPTLTIEIHGHICCNPNPNDTKLSFRRALVILKYLTKRGIAVNRLAFKGYGSNDPIYKVPERNEQERAANRRVEILIVAKR
jgi:outer membrane protein OmpA-like peptidoglycan-associated protein